MGRLEGFNLWGWTLLLCCDGSWLFDALVGSKDKMVWVASWLFCVMYFCKIVLWGVCFSLE